METMVEEKFKYNIKENMRKLSPSLEKDFMATIPGILGIAKSTLYKYINLKEGDSSSIPGEHLKKIALKFYLSGIKVSIEDLIND